MSLAGKLQEFSPVQLIQLLIQSRRSGRLSIENERLSASLFFEEGQVSYGSLGDQSSVFRESLLSTGKLSQELDSYIFANYRPATEVGLALLLEESCFLSREEIIEAETARLHDLVNLVLNCDNGSFRFDPGELPSPESVRIGFSLEGIIKEESRRRKEIETINQAIPDLNVVLRFAQQQGDRMRTLRLSTEEWKLIAVIDGKTTIQAIAAAMGIDDFKMRRLVHNLVSNGLVEFDGPVGDGGRQSPAMEQPSASAETKTKSGAIQRFVGKIRGT